MPSQSKLKINYGKMSHCLAALLTTSAYQIPSNMAHKLCCKFKLPLPLPDILRKRALVCATYLYATKGLNSVMAYHRAPSYLQ